MVRGSVTYTQAGFRSLVIGKYVGAAQSLVPRTEAPIRDLRSLRGWRIVVSSFLPRDKESDARLRIRFFDPDAKLRSTDEALMALEEIEVGRLFGGTDDVAVIQSNEEHSYNSMLDMWLLPERDKPQKLINGLNATLGRFSEGDNGTAPGLWIRRQTYDGIHAETKGWIDQFWRWNPAKKSLTLEKR